MAQTKLRTDQTDYPLATGEPSGFVFSLDESLLVSSEISFDSTTRWFTIEPTPASIGGDGYFQFFVAGKRFIKDSACTVRVPNVTEDYVIYFDNTGILRCDTIGDVMVRVFGLSAVVAGIGWNVTDKTLYLADYRYGCANSIVEIFGRTMFGTGISEHYLPLGDPKSIELCGQTMTGSDIREVQVLDDIQDDFSVFFDYDVLVNMHAVVEELKVKGQFCTMNAGGSGTFYPTIPVSNGSGATGTVGWWIGGTTRALGIEVTTGTFSVGDTVTTTAGPPASWVIGSTATYYYTKMPMTYIDSGERRMKAAQAAPIAFNYPTGRFEYNNMLSGGTLDEAPDKSYVAIYIGWMNSLTYPIIAILGQRFDMTLDDARANNTLDSMGGSPIVGMQYVARIIFYTDSTLPNPAHAYTVCIDKISHADFDQSAANFIITRSVTIQTESGNPYVMDGDEGTIIMDASGGPVSVTLTHVYTYPGRRYTIKRRHDSTENPVTINAQSGEYIDGMASKILAGDDSLDLVSDGTFWHTLTRPTLGQATGGTDGGGVAPVAGVIGDAIIKDNWKVVGWTVISDVTGDVVFDVQRCSRATFPGGLTSMPGGGLKPTMLSGSIGSGRISESADVDPGLSGWSLYLYDGDIVEFSVVSASTLTKAQVTLHLERV